MDTPQASPDAASLAEHAVADAPASGDPGADADPELPTDADLPPIEALDADSDYSQFMSPQVSQSLRSKALRKLFGDPAFNVRDGLDDYDEDYTRYQSLGDTVTADMKYHAERRARLAASENEDEDVAAAARASEPSAQAGVEPEPPAADDGASAPQVASTDHDPETDDDRG